MKYREQEYNILRKGFESDSNDSFSKVMKIDMESNRMNMLADVIDFLEENDIEYKQDNFNVVVKDFSIQPSMKVVFNGSKKAYQYNYTKCINLIESR